MTVLEQIKEEEKKRMMYRGQTCELLESLYSCLDVFRKVSSGNPIITKTPYFITAEVITNMAEPLKDQLSKGRK